MIKLCYKEYSYKSDLAAIKGFKGDTKEDLLFLLSSILECWSETKDMNMRSRINAIYSVCDFESAAFVFFHLIKGGGGNVPMAEIEDAMFRVGVSPNAVDDDFCLPWPVVLVKLAQDIEMNFQESIAALKKKMATSE